LRVTLGRIPFQKGRRLRFPRLADDSLRALAHRFARFVPQGPAEKISRRRETTVIPVSDPTGEGRFDGIHLDFSPGGAAAAASLPRDA